MRRVSSIWLCVFAHYCVAQQWSDIYVIILRDRRQVELIMTATNILRNPKPIPETPDMVEGENAIRVLGL